MDERLISIVVPVCNEEESIQTLIGEIRDVADASRLRVQVVFVDDGSTDASWTRIAELAAGDPRVGGLRFRRNAGKAAALSAGFHAARGEIVLMMDADLQDPPEEIPQLVAKLDEGYDVVSGWKRRRHDPWHKVYPSRVFNKLIGVFTGLHLHDHVCGLKCFRAAVVQEVCVYGELHRFLGVLAAARGFRVTEIPTLHRPRMHGRSKYGFARFAKGFLDLITIVFLTRYRWRPQHLIGVVGLLTILLTLLVWLAGLIAPILVLVLTPLLIVWSGLTLMAVGLVAEMVVARTPAEEQYIITERAGWCAQ